MSNTGPNSSTRQSHWRGWSWGSRTCATQKNMICTDAVKLRVPALLASVALAIYCACLFALWGRLPGAGSHGNSKIRATRAEQWKTSENTLAVVVPIHSGDITRAFVALGRWPTTCYHNTLANVDLIVYHADYPREAELLPLVPERASRCFRSTRIINANLSPEVGQSIMMIASHYSLSTLLLPAPLCFSTIYVQACSAADNVNPAQVAKKLAVCQSHTRKILVPR